MLVNNPMGSRRRRRFYHRAGVVPGPGGRCKTGMPVIDFFRFEPELYVQLEVEEQIEEGEYHLIPRMNQGDQEDRESAKLNKSRRATDEDIGQPAAAAASAAKQRAAPDSEQTAAPAAEQPTAPPTEKPTAPPTEKPTAPAAGQPIAPAAKKPTAPAADQPTAPATEQSVAPGAEQPAAPAADEAATKEIILDGDGVQSSN